EDAGERLALLVLHDGPRAVIVRAEDGRASEDRELVGGHALSSPMTEPGADGRAGPRKPAARPRVRGSGARAPLEVTCRRASSPRLSAAPPGRECSAAASRRAPRKGACSWASAGAGCRVRPWALPGGVAA